MERLRQEEAKEVRLSDDEVQAVLARLSRAEAEREARPTLAELAEAAGVPTERIAAALAEAREETATAERQARARRLRRVLRRTALTLAGVVGLVVLVNLPLLGPPGLRLTGSEVRTVMNSASYDGPIYKVEAILEARPRTLWQALTGPSVPYSIGSATLLTPKGEIEAVINRTGIPNTIEGDVEPWSSGRFRVEYRFPKMPESEAATRLRDTFRVGGDPVVIDVPLQR